MAQIDEQAVRQALAEAGAGGADARLRPEEIDRIKAAFAEADIDARVAKVTALFEELEAAAAGNEQRLADIQQGFGLEPGMSAKFLKSDRLGSGAQQDISQAIEADTAQLVDNARREARQALSGPRTARPPKVGRINI